MRDALAEHLVVHVGVGIDMHKAERTVTPGQGSQDW